MASKLRFLRSVRFSIDRNRNATVQMLTTKTLFDILVVKDNAKRKNNNNNSINLVALGIVNMRTIL
jgi:hypothetical protein